MNIQTYTYNLDGSELKITLLPGGLYQADYAGQRHYALGLSTCVAWAISHTAGR